MEALLLSSVVESGMSSNSGGASGRVIAEFTLVETNRCLGSFCCIIVRRLCCTLCSKA